MKFARPPAVFALVLALLWIMGCATLGFAILGCARSRVVTVSVINNSSQTLSNIVVDYPGATFGVSSLASGKTFQYRIQPSAAGALKIEFTNAQGKTGKYPGPVVHKDEDGAIEIRLTQDAVL